MAKIYVIEGPDKGESYDLKGEVLQIGRSSQNDIQIKDRSISARHLKLLQRGGKYFVLDLGSTNGTFVNGELVAPGQEVEIKEGDAVGIGNTLICLDREFTLSGTLVHQAVTFRGPKEGKAEGPPLEDRPAAHPRNLELLYKVSSVLMESLNLHEILGKIMDYLFECFQRIDRGAILLTDAGTGGLSEIISRVRDGVTQTKMDYSRTIVNRVVEQGKPVFMSDTAYEDEVELSDSIKSLNIRSVMCVPLVSRGNMRGVIYVDSLRIPHGFRREDLQLLVGLSTPAAIAIENALLYADMENLVGSRTASLQQTEKRLRKSEARFKAIFDTMQSGVVVCERREGPEERGFFVVDINRAAQDMDKIEKGAVAGKKVEEVFPGYSRMGFLDMFERVHKSGKAEHVPVSLYDDQKSSSWREYDVCRLPSGEIVCIYNDLTARMAAEEEQRLLQHKLLNAQKLESIGRLAGGVAHNFRNIMQAILGNVEYLEMVYGGDVELGETVRNIDKSVNKGIDLVNSLLQFSRQGGAYEASIVDLAEVIRDTHKIVERLFDKKIEVKLRLEDKLFVRGNHSLLSQVFMNLFANAKDAMPNGGNILVEAKRSGEQVFVAVSDTGFGMDKKTLEKIFDPFFTNKEVGKGTGLGLSTVHGIVEEHRGRITVASTPGRGTTFKIYLPLSKESGQMKAESEKQLVFGRGQKVMVVDDEEGALGALAGMIQGLGYEVFPVLKAEEALSLYDRVNPDVVILDRSMPEMDGVACLKEIVGQHPDARVIIVSGYEQAGPDGIEGSVKGLTRGYLTKPCGMEELGKMLHEVLGPE